MKIKNKMIFPFYILFLIEAVGAVGCKNAVPPVELIQYVEQKDNGLIITQQEGNIEFNLQYKPVDYVITQEKRSQTISKKDYQKLHNELKGVIYFNLNISSLNGTTKADPTIDNKSLASFFQFEFRNSIFLQLGDQALPCTLYHNQNNMGIYPYLTFVLGFEHEGEIDKDLTFTIIPSDNFLLGTNSIVLPILNKDIQKIPSLKLH